ncbi:MAG: methyltransferase domain-containing protein [Lachnospiraceae bacterium]|nr:methyltransferase domain-containing protein [Lachnospiraceae bacterium]
MKKEGYYSSGSFAAKAHVTKKTLRYYDEHGFLKPSYVNENGARFYTDQDFQKMQQIQLLKYLGFSLEDIREMTMKEAQDKSFVAALKVQVDLLEERMEQMKLVRESLKGTIGLLEKGQSVNWSALMDKISVDSLEKSFRQQYRNSSNINARIGLHTKYASNRQGWFPWLFEQSGIKAGESVLELGCGNGSFWLENLEKIPENLEAVVSDLSDGMLREVKKALGGRCPGFSFRGIDFHKIPLEDACVDLVIANHVLFYTRDLPKVLGEISRVLKPGGRLLCSTYGSRHMKEVSTLAAEFDDRIVLSAQSLYEIFGKENGKEILEPFFRDIRWMEYEDHLLVTEAEDLVDYIISCHGNQNRYIVNDYKEFCQFVNAKIRKGFYITKEAGAFLALRKNAGS